MQDLDQLRSYYLSDAFGEGSLFDLWEEGRPWGDSVTPSTYAPAYRAWMVTMLEHHIRTSGGKPLLSAGCGNAVIEAELLRRGCDVFAVDALRPAILLARRKGVKAVVADVARWQPPHRRWGLVYADGLLGHLYDPARGTVPAISRMSAWLDHRGGVFVASNDVPPADEDVREAPSVPGFYWLSTDFIAQQLDDARLTVLSTEEFTYERPRTGARRRAIVVAGIRRS